MAADMRPSGACRALVRKFEGLRLTAYRCPAGVATIGYGHTRNVRLGQTCTVQQADVWLSEDLEEAAAAVAQLVTVLLTQGQFDALTSFVLNLGAGALGKSTLLIMLNKGQYANAAGQFQLWTHSNGAVLPGLVARRNAEALLFLSGGVQS